MKYNLSVNGATLESYENISIYAKANLKAQIENKIADFECTELVCEDLLEVYPFKDYPAILECLSNKARKDCKIVLSIINGRRIADHAYFSEINNTEGNNLVFGETMAVKSIIFDQYDFVELLSKYGIQVVQIRVDGYKDIFTCKKQ